MKAQQIYISHLTRRISLVLTVSFMCFCGILHAQDSIIPKKVFLNKSDFESIITYSARDSIYSDFKKKQTHLYGDAKLNYEGVDMRANYLLIDLDKNEVLAIYTLDSLGNRIGEPVFVDDGDTIRAASIRYNFDTKKGYIQEVAIKQEEFFLSMEVAKRQSNEEVHFVKGKLTTCNLKDPHFHFFLSKAVLVPEKRIVSGPMNLWVLGVPTPIGLPFAIIPQKKKDQKSPKGFLTPQLSIVSAYGIGFQDLGYYIPINDRLQTTLYATLFSRGSFGFRTKTDYAKRYKNTGSFTLGYSRFRFGFPDSTAINATQIQWNHTQDPKSNPNWSFGSAVNFNSNSTNKQTLNVQNEQYFNNTLNSDIRLGRKFGSKPISADLKLNMRQNSTSKQIDLTAPIVNFQTTSRIFPFKSINKLIGVTYAAELQNRSTFKDRYLKNGDYDSINQQFRNGVNQRFNVQTTLNLLKNTLRFTPNINYTQFYNFQSIRKTVDTITNQAIVDSVNIGGFSHSVNASASLTTTLYSYYKFIGKRNTLLRHVLTPTISFNYTPAIQTSIMTYSDTLGKPVEYSPFERSIYQESASKSSGRIGFGVNNSFELKQKSEKDTVTGFKKIRLIDNFLLNTDYDIFKDSMNWSDLNIRLVINPIQTFSVTINAIHSWYSWNEVTGKQLSTYAVKNGQGLGRIRTSSVATSWVITTKKNRELVQQQQIAMAKVWNPQYQNWLMNPGQMVSFEIPWKISLEHVFALSLNADPTNYLSKRYVPTNTLRASGDVSISQNWKIASTLMYDAETGKVSNLNFNLFRNIHCWNVGFNWTAIGTNKNFSVNLRANAAALSNVNVNLRKPPIVF